MNSTSNPVPREWRQVTLIARRELLILFRSRGSAASVALLFAIAWLPPILISLRGGRLGLAPFAQFLPLAVALSGIVLSLLGLLAGAELLAGELERGSLSQVLTLPISRRALLLGKWLGRGGTFLLAYGVAFGSLTLAILARHGQVGVGDYLATAASGLLLAGVCFGVGTVVGAAGRGRTRALGMALGSWVLFVFALDAIILAVVVALAPPPPEEVGRGGHGELAPVQHQHDHEHMGMDLHERGNAGDAVQAEADKLPWPAWLMLLDPVDLFRLSILSASPSVRTQFLLGLPDNALSTWVPITVGWAAWLLLPYAWALSRFRRLAIRASA